MMTITPGKMGEIMHGSYGVLTHGLWRRPGCIAPKPANEVEWTGSSEWPGLDPKSSG